MKIKKNVTGLWGLVKDTVHSLMSLKSPSILFFFGNFQTYAV